MITGAVDCSALTTGKHSAYCSGVQPTQRDDPRRACTDGLRDRTLAVIGGSSGIGLATAIGALGAGVRVWVMARDKERLARAATGAGEGMHTQAGDASNERDVEAFFAATGGIDHLLLSAGSPMFAPVATMDIDAGLQWLADGLRSILLSARHAPWVNGGSLTLMSASAVRRPRPGGGLLGALARSTEYLAETLALELAPVRVNVIAPGFVPTPLTERMLSDHLPARVSELQQSLPTRRVTEPNDIASLILQVMINPAITGAVIPIDGGQILA